MSTSYKSTEEGLPYTGSVPRVQTVLFVMYLDTEPGVSDRGTGSITPYFSSEGSRHLPMEGVSGGAIRWTTDGVLLTVTPQASPSTICKGKLSADRDTVELLAAGCPLLSDQVSVSMVTFKRSDR